MQSQHRILVVDDDPFILGYLLEALKRNGFAVTACKGPEEALERLRGESFDLALSDILMPGMTGLQLLDHFQRLSPEMPVILMTGYPELDKCIEALKRGAFDFMVKPFRLDYLLHTVARALQLKRLRALEQNYKAQLELTIKERTQELSVALRMVKNLNRELINRLTIVSEYKNLNTGIHISRIGLFTNKISEALDMPEDFTEALTYASSMHDIGKVGIPDNILLKPGELSPREFEVMKQHTVFGRDILAGSEHEIIRMAETIALCHHERWDGTGYPGGLRAEAIPLEARITLLCDQYDALRSERPYKPAYGHEAACRIMLEGDGRTRPCHFDPEVLRCFREVAPVMEEIYDCFEVNATGPEGSPRDLPRLANRK